MNASDNAYYSRLYRIWSVIALGAGTRLLAETSSLFDTPEEMYGTLTSGGTMPECVPAEAVKAAETPLSAAEKIIEYCDRRNIQIVTPDEQLYPQRLRSIYAPPAALFYMGDISGMDERLSMGIVGTRHPAEYSRRVASGIVRMLSRYDFDIISGFAEGIDICAHLAAARSGAKTFAVLGTGLDYIYPKNNAKYREEIIESGALITEYLPATRPYPCNFPQRNRILSGLSLGVAVIEAGEKSGSLNTASHATEQGKCVFAVPPCDLFDRRYAGNVQLIREGAVPLMGAKDILNEYCDIIPHTIVENKKPAPKPKKEKIYEETYPSAGEKQVKIPSDENFLSDGEITAAAENDTQANILRCLNGSRKRADELVEMLSEDIGEILTALTELEISGTIAAENGAYRIL